MKLRYHLPAHLSHIDNDKDGCEIVWVDHAVDHLSVLTSVHVSEILLIAPITVMGWCLRREQ